MRIVVGTRGSELAVGQAEPLVQHLQAAGHEIEWRRFTTHGDRWLAGPLDKAEGTGFFTRELEEALSARRRGPAHPLLQGCGPGATRGFRSCLRAPAGGPCGLAGCPARRARGTPDRHQFGTAPALPPAGLPCERLHLDPGQRAHPRPAGAGRAAPRTNRSRPPCWPPQACAGWGLDLSDLDVRPLPFDQLLPAPAQGALLAETLAERQDVIEALRGLHHPLTHRCVHLERAVLAGIGGGCQQPLGAFAEPLPEGSIRLRAAFADGRTSAGAPLKGGTTRPWWSRS